ncbi:membrane protein [Liquorilactobacillus ghanensis DSM 18630]|jgi:uncharacterized membrane protein YqgA involved in biofilm formation|uniref:Membrane protein n=1 Tax=Liquorilactobacillus ghanensis DSM 18630 TaxID=1423750 RepID=A0A0R1VPI1_9LACO|nr:DUF554 domain-containing protein [Liquorilactobacillus ghanensis]KRM04723.1 membrane protein [Liquorilactobacillus ghanensis DSM 18630]
MFIGIGTLVNTGAVIIGGLGGYLFQRILTKKMQETLMQALGTAVIFIGISGALSQILVIKQHTLTTKGTMLAAISLALGAFIGELLNIEGQFNRLGSWLRMRIGRQNDSKFIDAFVIATLTTCVGAMAIIGPLQDALAGDPTMLFTKAILDGVIVALYTAALGIGAIFCALPILIFQGGITLLATIINPWLNTAMTNGISLVGSMMIFCIGLNLLLNCKIRVANMLPAILVVLIYGILK